jgi:conjugal transfer pilus assembly protein TraA
MHLRSLSPTPVALAAAALVLLAALAPEAVLAGTGGTMTGILGRIIAITFIIVGLVAGVMRQSIMGFVVGIAAGLGVFVAPNIIDGIVTATLPIL